jgi:hypothetical protein
VTQRAALGVPMLLRSLSTVCSRRLNSVVSVLSCCTSFAGTDSVQVTVREQVDFCLFFVDTCRMF